MAEPIVHQNRAAEIALGQGKPVKGACCQLGVAEQSDYRRRKEHGGLTVDQAKRRQELEWEPC